MNIEQYRHGMHL